MKPTVIIVMEGGVVQNVMADAEVDVLCIDYDGEEDSDAVRIPQDKDGLVQEGDDPLATFGRLDVEHEPKLVRNLMKIMPE